MQNDPISRLVIVLAYLAYRKQRENTSAESILRFQRISGPHSRGDVRIWNKNNEANVTRMYVGTYLAAGYSEIKIYLTLSSGTDNSHSRRFYFDDPDFIQLVKNEIEHAMKLIAPQQ